MIGQGLLFVSHMPRLVCISLDWFVYRVFDFDLDWIQWHTHKQSNIYFLDRTDLDRIITQIVKPKVSVYMAIDGVAPRAKLNQQRSRRYRSARDMAESLKEQQQEQERNNKNKDGSSSSSSSAAAFDSNCITPGTEFLAKVSELIRFFVRTKLRDDPVWRNLTVIFSGHDIPGEGEHKIMNHIRRMKEQPHYQPNTRHVMYGQDADLILLGLVTHEPHFTILREVVNFQSFKRHDAKNSLQQVQKFTKESDFQLLHLSVLREYLAIDFCFVGAASNASTVEDDKEDDETNPRTTAPQTFDLERCIDDFVFMTFLVGNGTSVCVCVCVLVDGSTGCGEMASSHMSSHTHFPGQHNDSCCAHVCVRFLYRLFTAFANLGHW